MSARMAGFLFALIALALAAVPAEAFMTGLERIIPFTATTSVQKSLTATCPAGKRIIALGADTTPGNGRVLIDQIRPSNDLTSATLHASEDQAGTPDAWYLQAFLICAPAPAGLQLVRATSPSNSVNKSVTATCPSGKRLLGAGAEITGARTQVLLDGLVPDGALQKVTANALEDEGTGTAANWSITAYAICASGVAGLQRIAVTGPANSNGSRLVTATCPLGKSLVGIYGAINSANRQVVLDALFSDVGLTSATISAFEDATGNSGNWSLTAIAVCASATQLATVASPGRGTSGGSGRELDCPPGMVSTSPGGSIVGGFGRLGLQTLGPGLPTPAKASVSAMSVPSATVQNWELMTQSVCTTAQANISVVRVESILDSETPKSVTAACPPGKRVIGTGASAGGITFATDRILTGIVPNAALTTVTATMHEQEAGFASNWRVSAYAVCAPAPAGLQRVVATSAPGSDEFATVTATCPAGKHVIGLGGSLNGAGGQALIDDLMTNAALSKVTMTGFEDTTGFDPLWTATAYAICISR